MSPRFLVTAMCVAEALGMLGFSTFPALLPVFLDEWRLTGTEAGMLSGLFFAGYMVAVPLLTGLTDRLDARQVYLYSALLTGGATLAFALFAHDFWSAAPLRLLAGVGLAGTYMPGLRALTDRIPERNHPRAVSFYTASFGVGASASYLFAGLIVDWLDWRWAFGLSVLGTALGLAIVLMLLRPRPAPRDPPAWRAILDFRPVLRNREAMAYILAYAGHNWELFGFRSWIVAFLAFSLVLSPDPLAAVLTGTAVAAIVNLLGLPSSVMGNEFATRFDRRIVVSVIMGTSALLGCLVGFAAGLPYALVVGLLVLYGITVTGESASVTTGTVLVAAPQRKGAAMALHSFLGFAFAFLGSVMPGVVLDLAGGTGDANAWVLAFVCMALGAAVGPLLVLGLTRRRVRVVTG